MKIPRKSGPARVLRMESDYIVEDRGYESPCWVWQGDVERNGYGRIYQDGKRHKAHRLMYELLVDPIPKGRHLHHKCEQPICVNPDHLEPKAPGKHFNDHRSAEWYTKRPARQAPPYVAEIRRLYATGNYTFAQLGEKFGIAPQSAHRIVRGERYPSAT